MINRSVALFFNMSVMLSLLTWMYCSAMTMDPPEVPVRSYENLEISKFQQLIAESAEKGEPWVNDTLQITLRFIGLFEGKIQQITRKHDSAESARRAEIVVIEDGYLDDSIRGARYEFILEKDAKHRWQLITAKKAWRCWPDRGHDDFSKQPCL